MTTIDRIPGLLEGTRCLVIKEDRKLNLDLNHAKHALVLCLSKNRMFELAPTGDGVITTTLNLTHSSHVFNYLFDFLSFMSIRSFFR